ncbi:SDR family oxidoreductase [Streptomyces sp. NPDC007905]|uniref:SDR family NAD(P)-dependent oxidoreductase n=1 Tax=Streptomyces sp. NPDC007905 TaxID=3364788 RepID=UPI0036EA64EE
METQETVVITGAASGIGRGGALYFAERGVAVVLLDRDPAGEAVAVEIRGQGGDAVFVSCDVSDETSVRDAFATAVPPHTRLTGVWSNAGVAHYQSLEDTSLTMWNGILATNLTGAFLVTRAALPFLSRGSSILFTGSISSMRGSENFAAYCASKGGLMMFAKALALELAPRGIRVNVIAPGAVDTPMQHADMMARPVPYAEAVAAELSAHPLGRYASPQEVAESAYFLMSRASSFTTGATLLVDGGYSA